VALEFSDPRGLGRLPRPAARSARRPGGADLEGGVELDREIELCVFGRVAADAVPPFSTEDWTAAALADLVARRTGWTFDIAQRDGIWEAVWIERPATAAAPGAKKRRIQSLVTATGETSALAICRSLLRATSCPSWPADRIAGGGIDATFGFPAPLRSAAARTS
jgi:hypothetical protein